MKLKTVDEYITEWLGDQVTCSEEDFRSLVEQIQKNAQQAELFNWARITLQQAQKHLDITRDLNNKVDALGLPKYHKESNEHLAKGDVLIELLHKMNAELK